MATDQVEVREGRLRGAERDGLWCFSGIPYAAAPVGPLRWRPPQPHPGWSGVREAVTFGPVAPQQTGPGGGLLGESAETSEDCLTLNVWTPGLSGRRPVMVWIHGGSFTSGSGSNFLYRGADLARAGDVVVVSCNYRLGALGFLAHPALSAGGPLGNYGLYDQLAVLRWVADHAERFGGDPGAITVFGESAGGMSISALLAAPAARGLFHRAAIQSGPVYVHTAARAEEVATDLFAVLGRRDPERADLERVPADDLVAAGQEIGSRMPPPGESALRFLPVVDGDLIPRHPLEAVAGGEGVDVPLLTGTNRDEMTLFSFSDPRLSAIDAASLRRWVAHAVPDGPVEEIIAAYAATRRRRGEDVGPQALWTAIGSDVVFRWPTLALAAAHHRRRPDTFVYLFTHASEAFGGVLGSCHGLEIPFVFGSVGRPVIADIVGRGPEVDALSARMLGAWTAFARSGDPSHEGAGPWPPWDPDRRTTMVFGPDGGVRDRPRDDELAVWPGVHPVTMPLR